MLSAKKTGWLAICVALIAVLLVSSFPFVGVPLGSKSSGNSISIACAQDGCAGCSNSYQEFTKTKADWENCADEDKVRYYQRYLAASNKFTQCLNRGCDTGLTGPPTASPDFDGDGVPDDDNDGILDIDDTDWDNDGIDNSVDNCPLRPNPNQEDADDDGIGDICDECPRTELGVAVDAKGCPEGMQLRVFTDTKIYSPEETVIVSGSVRDAKSGGPISDANVVIDINPKVSTTTDSSGNYKKGVLLPSDISQGKHTVTVTASKTGYPAVSETTSFSVGQALIVEISTDKIKCESLFSLVGEKIYCTITVKNAATGKLVPYADLKVITTRLCTRKATELSGFTDGIGENTWSFPLEERLKIEVTASRDGYSDGHKTIIYPEDCFWSPEVCKCDANRICDPWSEYADLFGCSPKVAYVILNPDSMNFWEMWWATEDIKECRRMYKERGYKVRYLDMGKESSIIMINALQNPSTKAIGYFGHSAVPELAGATATMWRNNLQTDLLTRYREQCMDVEKAKAKAKEDANQLDLDYAYLWTCHSLDDTSLPDWLLHNGGVVWGTRGNLYVISGPDIKLRKTENGIYEKCN